MQTKIWISFMLCCSAPVLVAALAAVRLNVRVIDEAGVAIPNAEVRASTFSHHVPGDGAGEDKHATVSHLTDSAGIATLDFSSLTGHIGYGPKKSGYYLDQGSTYQFLSVQAGQWQPWNPMFEFVLKPILTPIPLYGKKVDLLPIPAQDTTIGYDLMAGDWVTPRGQGTNADVIFNFHRQFTNVALPFDLRVVITFPNAGDGLLAVSTPYRQGSILRLRAAPEAGYTNSLTKRIFRASVSTPIDLGTDENRSYFFRVRAQQSNGQVTSALYGKIYSDIALSAFGKLRFTYYLNPTPNSRNLEFNTKSNLLAGLKSFEKPSEP